MRLLVVGDTLLDRDVVGTVERVCPDAPVPVVDVTGVRERPGGAGLTALLAARDGVEVVLATGLGRDVAGRRVRAMLERRVRVHDVLVAETTPGKTRVRAAGQSLVRLDDHGHLLGVADPYDEPTSEVDASALRELALGCDAVLVADYGGTVSRHPVVRAVLTEVAARVPVVWDPHPRGLGPVPGCAAVTPNRGEALAMSGSAAGSPDAGLVEVAALLATQWSAVAVTVTDGVRGVVVSDGSTVPALDAGAVADTCGAGDRYAGALALSLAGGADVRSAVAVAVADVGRWLAAGGVTADDGTADTSTALSAFPVEPAEVVLEGSPDADAVVATVRARGGTVVATGGCFDVLHAGHLQVLREARALGDALVVLLNSDASVRRLKGPGRPAHAAADRVRLLEALRVVDAVVVFEDDDPVDTLRRLRPDVWVKGGDYTADVLPETPVVEAAGGRVVVVPFLAGHSTTRLLSGRGAP
ncbi:MAG TPA: PfkB family carbohydrate kinase [Actinomycetales bacterium]